MKKQKSLPEHLVELLNGGHAHVDFDGAVKNWPANLQGMRPEGAAHSPGKCWSTCACPMGHSGIHSQSPACLPEFPAGYWPKTQAPPTAKPGAKARMRFVAT